MINVTGLWGDKTVNCLINVLGVVQRGSGLDSGTMTAYFLAGN